MVMSHRLLKSSVIPIVFALSVLCVSATNARDQWDHLATEAHREADGVHVNEFKARFNDWAIHHGDGHTEAEHLKVLDKGDRERFRAMVDAFERMKKRYADAGIK